MDITLLSAQDLARLFAARELSPVEVAVATFERIEAMQALDTPLRLFTWTGRDAALQAAHRAERAWRERRDNHPLCGVPFSVKDCLAVRAAPRTHGSALFGGQLCAHDDPAVARLRAAGAVF
ncbi:amidase family protein, partial [Burkholderia sola]